MLQYLISEIKETLICLKAGRVTLPYPLKVTEQALPKEGFRGQPEVNFDLCIGCGACASVCPPKLIGVIDENGIRYMPRELARCTYCGRCEDVCPQKAITMTMNFELATDNKDDLFIGGKFKMVKCSECNEYFTTRRILNKLKENLPIALGLEKNAISYLNFCPACKRKESLKGDKYGNT